MRATDILKSDIGAQAAWRNYAVNEEAINKIEIKEDEYSLPAPQLHKSFICI